MKKDRRTFNGRRRSRTSSRPASRRAALSHLAAARTVRARAAELLSLVFLSLSACHCYAPRLAHLLDIMMSSLRFTRRSLWLFRGSPSSSLPRCMHHYGAPSGGGGVVAGEHGHLRLDGERSRPVYGTRSTRFILRTSTEYPSHLLSPRRPRRASVSPRITRMASFNCLRAASDPLAHFALYAGHAHVATMAYVGSNSRTSTLASRLGISPAGGPRWFCLGFCTFWGTLVRESANS
jgi:hypothetical protein